jgi:hypothetical protein
MREGLEDEVRVQGDNSQPLDQASFVIARTILPHPKPLKNQGKRGICRFDDRAQIALRIVHGLTKAKDVRILLLRRGENSHAPGPPPACPELSGANLMPHDGAPFLHCALVTCQNRSTTPSA